MKSIKRSGEEAAFDQGKITAAISKASAAAGADGIGEPEIKTIAVGVALRCDALGRAVSVEEVQDMVVEEIAAAGHFKLMRLYSDYRHKRESIRQGNSTDGKILNHSRKNGQKKRRKSREKNDCDDTVEVSSTRKRSCQGRAATPCLRHP